MVFILLNDRKNMMMWSSLVYEILGPKKYTIHYSLIFKHRARKHHGLLPCGLKFSGSSTSGIPLRLWKYGFNKWSSLEFEIQAHTYRTLFNYLNGVLSIVGLYPEGWWHFQSHLQVVNHCQCENMVIW